MADGVGKGILSGAASGAKLGGLAGSAVPGVGNAVGTAIGGGVGAIAGGLSANRNKKKDPNRNLPALEDPTQTARMLEIDRIAKNIQSGTDAATQSGINQNRQNLAATQNRLSRSSGGNSSALTDALLKAQKSSDMANNQVIAQGQQRLPFYQNLGQQLSGRASQRALELELLDRGQKSAERASAQQSQNVNRNAALASGLPGLSDAASRSEVLKKLLKGQESDVSTDQTLISDTRNNNLTDAISLNQNTNPLGSSGDGNSFGLSKGGELDSLNDVSALTSNL